MTSSSAVDISSWWFLELKIYQDAKPKGVRGQMHAYQVVQLFFPLVFIRRWNVISLPTFPWFRALFVLHIWSCRRPLLLFCLSTGGSDDASWSVALLGQIVHNWIIFCAKPWHHLGFCSQQHQWPIYYLNYNILIIITAFIDRPEVVLVHWGRADFHFY